MRGKKFLSMSEVEVIESCRLCNKIDVIGEIDYTVQPTLKYRLKIT